MRRLIASVLLIAAGSPITVIEEPMCTPPLGASHAWLAEHDTSGRFELPSYAEWTEGYPNYGVALGYLDQFTGDDVLGVFTEHELQRIVLVVDVALSDEALAALVGELEAGYPSASPPVDVARSCYPLEQTRRVVDTLVAGTWHESLTVSTPTGGTWSVISYPALGGAVEVWVAEAPTGLEDELTTLLGEDAELLRLVVGEELLDPPETSTTAGADTTTAPAPTEVDTTRPTEANQPAEPPQPAGGGNAGRAVLAAAAAVFGLLGAGLLAARRRNPS